MGPNVPPFAQPFITEDRMLKLLILAAEAVLFVSALLAAPLGAQQPLPAPGPAPRPFEPLDRGVTAFVDVSVVSMESDAAAAAEHQTVLVRDGRIAAVGPVARVAVPSGATRVDGRGKWLMPGLIDMHAHMQPGRGDPGDPTWRHFALLLANGITTARGLGAPAGWVSVRERARAGEVVAPALFVASPSINGNSTPTPDAARRLVEAAKAGGYDLLKTHGGLTRETYDTTVAAAKRAGLLLSGHVSQGYGYVHALESGQQIEHLDGFLYAALRDGVAVPPDANPQFVLDEALLSRVDPAKVRTLAEATRKAGVCSGPTIALFRIVASPDPWAHPDSLAARPEMRYAPKQALAAWRQQKAAQAAEFPDAAARHFVALRDTVLRALYAAGAPIIAGSDSPQFFLVAGFSLHRELEALASAGLPTPAVLAATTRTAAACLGQSAETGTVTTGKRADLLLLDANPLADVANTRNAAGVMVRGKWLPRSELQQMLAGVEESLR